MGLGYTKIYFEAGIPPFAKINAYFRIQTGFGLGVNASLNLTELGSIVEVSEALKANFDSVNALLKEKEAFEESHPNDYKRLTDKKIEIHRKLDSFVRIQSLSFSTWLYEIDFEVQGNCLKIESYANQFYVIESLIKVLIDDLGGSFRNDEALIRSRKKWKSLKPWAEYKWYNRPAK